MVFLKPTPGVAFLLRGFVHSLIPLTTFFITFLILNDLGVAVPLWIAISSVALGIPTVVALRIIFKDVCHRRRAAALGARPVPRCQGKWPGNLDLLKHMLKVSRDGYPGDSIWPLIEKLGSTFDFHFFWERMVFTVEPEIIKIMLATDFANYVKGDKFRACMTSVLGTGVFNSDGDMWKFHRSITRMFFTRDRITHFDIFDRQADILITQIKERMRAGYAVDFQDLISRFTLDSASEFLFGVNIGSLSNVLPYPHNTSARPVIQSNTADDFATAFGKAQFVASQRARIGCLWPLFEIFQDKTAEHMEVVNAFLDPILNDAAQKYESKHAGLKQQEMEKADDEDTLLDHLLKITTDRSVLRDEILNIMIAGRDTTAAVLTFVIYCLSSNPAVLDRLRQEIGAHVGPSARPTYDNIRDMKYLRAVINETLRLFPPVPFNIRETVGETTWPSQNPDEKPMYIPAGTRVPYSTFVMHRRTDLWGPDALVFDPDRFLDDRVKKYLVRNPFMFLPFNAGPRLCLGQQFAYNEMSFMLIRLLQNFSSIQVDTTAQPSETLPPASWAQESGRKSIEQVWPKVHLTMYAQGGLWVRMDESQE